LASHADTPLLSGIILMLHFTSVFSTAGKLTINVRLVVRLTHSLPWWLLDQDLDLQNIPAVVNCQLADALPKIIQPLTSLLPLSARATTPPPVTWTLDPKIIHHQVMTKLKLALNHVHMAQELQALTTSLDTIMWVIALSITHYSLYVLAINKNLIGVLRSLLPWLWRPKAIHTRRGLPLPLRKVTNQPSVVVLRDSMMKKAPGLPGMEICLKLSLYHARPWMFTTATSVGNWATTQ